MLFTKNKIYFNFKNFTKIPFNFNIKTNFIIDYQFSCTNVKKVK